ncbi:MAG: cyclic nucleotide-binding domain-containing protein [Desulfobacterales bacterium]|nr:cyclic nucleotide-binding domain-containing protein [Desulfobacterales bacterium]
MKPAENIDLEKIWTTIKQLDFFDNFLRSEKQRILEFHSHFIMYEKDETIIQEGLNDNAFYILLAGSVSITKNMGNQQVEIAQIQPGDIFGEISFLTNTLRTSNVISNEKSLVIMVDKLFLEKLTPEIREKLKDRIIEKLINRLDKMNNAFVKLSYLSGFG